jgi:hypothetical protein
VGQAVADLSRHQGDYGFDAPYVTILLAGGGLALLSFGVLDAAVFGSIGLAILPLVSGIAMLLSAASLSTPPAAANSRCGLSSCLS